MKRIAIDMDDVMADTTARIIEWYERDFNTSVNRADLIGKRISEFVPKEHERVINDYSRHPDVFKDLSIIPESQRVIEALTKEYEVFIVTAAIAFPNSYLPKYEWLKEHFPFIDIRNVVFCGHKYMIDADYMIDDHPRNLEHFKGKGLLFTTEHNRLETRFERVDNWFDVENLLLS